VSLKPPETPETFCCRVSFSRCPFLSRLKIPNPVSNSFPTRHVLRSIGVSVIMQSGPRRRSRRRFTSALVCAKYLAARMFSPRFLSTFSKISPYRISVMRTPRSETRGPVKSLFMSVLEVNLARWKWAVCLLEYTFPLYPYLY
jgi:hypothetical protein